jgi:hypothetical protein
LLEILNVPIYPHVNVDPLEAVADYLLDNGVTFTPAIPGPSDADPNIMELCFRNGENHMRDKIKTSLLKLSADMTCVTIRQVIKILEDLQ